MDKYKIIDLFAGAGGLSNGFEQTGRFQVIGAVEINNDATKTYIENHGKNKDIIIRAEENKSSDITKINFKDFVEQKNLNTENTIVIGGPPCQGFSNANRQKNYLISGNNQLVKEYARAIDEVRPIAFLMENVKTMHSKTHKFFVTEDDQNSTLKYSSEKHLLKITEQTNGEVFWEEDSLVLIETDQLQLLSLIEEILSKGYATPILKNATHIARVRSIVRKLKSSKPVQMKTTAELNETKNLIDFLETLELSAFENKALFREVVANLVLALRMVLDNKVTDRNLANDLIQPFIVINQLLRYLEELKMERIIFTKKPEQVLTSKGTIEVVVGVKSYNIVKYLDVFFNYLGYNISMEVIKSVNFFVPQKRERFMILGIKKEKSPNGVNLPKPMESSKVPFTVEDAIKDLEKIEPTKKIEDNIQLYDPDLENLKDSKMNKYYRKDMIDKTKIYNHINTDSEDLSIIRFSAIRESGGKNFHSLSEDLKNISYADSTRTQNTIYLRLNYDTPSPTVINVRKSMWQHPTEARALSIREAARLQSFKDNFIFIGSKDKQYQQIGNAVPPLMARAVAEQMLVTLGDIPVATIESEFL